MTSEAALQTLVETKLGQNLTEDALFFSELLVSVNPSEVNKHLLAVTLWISNRRSGAADALKGCQTPSNRYLRASYLFELGRREEAFDELLHGTDVHSADTYTLQNLLQCTSLPGGAAGAVLAGHICENGMRGEHAAVFYRHALDCDPTMWSALEALSKLGHTVDTAQLFHPSKAASVASGLSAAGPSSAPAAVPNPSAVPAAGHVSAESATAAVPRPAGGRLSFSSAARGLAFGNSPSGTATPQHTPAVPGPDASSMAPRSHAALQSALHFISPSSPLPSPHTPATRMGMATPNARSAAHETPQHHVSLAPRTGATERVQAHSRASNEVTPADDTTQGGRTPLGGGMGSTPDSAHYQLHMAHSTTQPQTALKRTGRSATVRRKLKMDRRGSLGSVTEAPEDQEGNSGGEHAPNTHMHQGAVAVLQLLGDLARVATRVWGHKCAEADEVAAQLPAALANCIPALRWRGEALSEAARHSEAVTLFQQLRLAAPWSLQGLHLLSTALWHTGATDALICLAQELQAQHRDHAVTWIAAGNALSASGDHGGALSMFKRALQVQPDSTYAACLAGHEAVALDKTEEAVMCFRKALSSDARSFVAWFGLGGVHYRAEEWQQALVHFQRAVSIFPLSSTLQCYCGMAQGKLGRVGEGMGSLRRSIALDARNAQAWFQLAQLQEASGDMQGAYSSLLHTEELAPKEANVQMLKGKVCQAMQLAPQAVAAYNRALELSPKEANAIYRALDSVFSGSTAETAIL